ncbi:MAG: 4-alpha-glucanotransferase [Clostridia bacterium]|nr:4-alpha-glucanotransferase [Clostridia bacterium]
MDKYGTELTRGSGVFLHIASLPSIYGIGSLGKQAIAFADFLEAAKQKYWQILPVNEPDNAHSPYSSCSAFAGYDLLIDIDKLVEDGLLRDSDIDKSLLFEQESIDYVRAQAIKRKAFRTAFERFDIHDNDYRKFCKSNDFLANYSIYRSARRVYGNEWSCWEGLRNRDPLALENYSKHYSDNIEYEKFVQYLFDRQWREFKAEVYKRGIKLIGDIPMYVNYDSADVWSEPMNFLLNGEHAMDKVAGVPPDYFSEEGQLWGNPIYDYAYMRKNGYAWWKNRIKRCAQLYDILRIDHFRAFDAYYTIDARSESAKNGKWMDGEGKALTDAIVRAAGDLKIIAEDLGVHSDGVQDLMQQSGFCGMKVMQFAFDGNDGNPFLPHNYQRNCVAYIGTHDNDTLIGWWNGLSREAKERVYWYTGFDNDSNLNRKLIKFLSRSVADVVIFTMQDILGQGTEKRTNTPSTCVGNWEYAMKQSDLKTSDSDYLAMLSKLYSR